MKTRKVYLYKAVGEVEFDQVKKGDLFVLLKAAPDDCVDENEIRQASEDAKPINDPEDPHATMAIESVKVADVEWQNGSITGLRDEVKHEPV